MQNALTTVNDVNEKQPQHWLQRRVMTTMANYDKAVDEVDWNDQMGHADNENADYNVNYHYCFNKGDKNVDGDNQREDEDDDVNHTNDHRTQTLQYYFTPITMTPIKTTTNKDYNDKIHYKNGNAYGMEYDNNQSNDNFAAMKNHYNNYKNYSNYWFDHTDKVGNVNDNNSD